MFVLSLDCAADGNVEALLLLLDCAGDGDLEALRLLPTRWECGDDFEPSRPDPSNCAGDGDLDALTVLLPSRARSTNPSDLAGDGDLEALLLLPLSWAFGLSVESP